MRAEKKAFPVIVAAALAAGSARLHAQELSELCPDADADNSAAVVGQVRDLDSGVGLPGSRVVAFWGEAEARMNARGMVGADGSYTLCGLPRDVELKVSASFVGLHSPTVAVTCTEPVTRQDLGIALSPDSPSFIPYDTPPKLKNGAEIKRLLEKNYPRNLKKNQAAGTVVLWVYINKNGRVEKSVVHKRSFHPEFDVAALKIAAQMRFVPAKVAGKPTEVWVQMPINFGLK